MPVSIAEGKKWSCDRIQDAAPDVVVDVGAGQGTYSIMARHLCPRGSHWIAVEIWEPYVSRFVYEHNYSEVLLGDVREIDLPTADLYIFGDVLEHMPKADAQGLIAYVKGQAKRILVSVPIVEAPQGAWEGNPHEAHEHHWDFADMWALLDYTPQFYRGSTVGCFMWIESKLACDKTPAP